MKAHYIIRQGEPLVLQLLAVEGEVEDVTEVNAVLKSAGPNGSVPPISAPVVATFEVQPVPAPDVGWELILDEEDTVALKPGFYITNARLDLTSGGPLKTEHVIIEIRGSVT